MTFDRTISQYDVDMILSRWKTPSFIKVI